MHFCMDSAEPHLSLSQVVVQFKNVLKIVSTLHFHTILPMSHIVSWQAQMPSMSCDEQCVLYRSKNLKERTGCTMQWSETSSVVVFNGGRMKSNHSIGVNYCNIAHWGTVVRWQYVRAVKTLQMCCMQYVIYQTIGSCSKTSSATPGILFFARKGGE